jgi:2-iminobutanoate/2-iminopropanoate deaminase
MRQAITTGGKVPAPLSPAVVAEGKFAFVSGQVPFRDGEFVDGTIEEQTALSLENLRGVLAAAGATPADVVRVNVYLADVADFAAMNRVYAEFFPDPKPARTTVGVTMAGPFKVEIDCVALLS